MIAPFTSLLMINSHMSAGAQSDFVYAILPTLALALGVVCITSYITTRIVKKYI